MHHLHLGYILMGCPADTCLIPFIRKILRILVFWIERRKNIYSTVITKNLRLSNWCRENNLLF